MRRALARLGGRVGAAAVLAHLLTAPAVARPLELNDILKREGVGAAAVDPTERWLVLERQAPVDRAFRFDLELFHDLARTRLERLDLRHPTHLEPLFAATRRAGYALGPFSPDGLRVAVYRLTDTSWDLGVATLATGHVRWLPASPEFMPFGRAVQWVNSTDLLVLARPPGELPFHLRARSTAALRLPGRWRDSAVGPGASTVVGSGRWLSIRPQAAARTLFRIEVRTGRKVRLARGPFIDVEVSPNGRWAGLVAEDGDNPMAPGQPIQGDNGFEAQARRLQLIDLATSALTTPCALCDVAIGPLAWSADGQNLLVFARRSGQPWRDGRLSRLNAPDGSLTDVPLAGIRPQLELRPERVQASWLGNSPVVWGAPIGSDASPRNDWYLLAPSGPQNLTAGLTSPSAERVVVGRSDLIDGSADGLWRIAAGTQAQLATHLSRARPTAPAADGRGPFVIDREGPWLGVGQADGGPKALAVAQDGSLTTVVVQPDSVALAAAPHRGGLLVKLFPAGGEEQLQWVERDGHAVTLATLNRHLANVDTPRIRPVQHPGPSGDPVTSWLLLPAQTPGPPPPLIVWPYLGNAFPTPPYWADLRSNGFNEKVGLLVGHGYAVLVPSLPWTWNAGEAAAGLADHILSAVDAAAADPVLKGTFDPKRLGLWGYSFGGYTTLVTITQTSRFKAAIAQASMSDLASLWGQFQGPYRVDPSEGVGTFDEGGWVEDLQAGMHAPPYADPQRYVRNSAIFHAGQVTTPLLLLHGEQDSFGIGQAEEMFSALWRQNKDAELVTFWGEGHIIANPGNRRTMYRHIFAWFDTYLGEVTPGSGAVAPSPNPERESASGGPRTRSPRRP